MRATTAPAIPNQRQRSEVDHPPDRTGPPAAGLSRARASGARSAAERGTSRPSRRSWARRKRRTPGVGGRLRGEVAAGTRTRRRCGRVEGMLSIIGPIRRLRHGPLTLCSQRGTRHAWTTAPPRRAPAAPAACMRRRSRHGAPLNARLATVAKPSSSARSASSRCAMRSAGGQPGLGHLDAPAEHAPPAGRHEHRAGLADEPDAERAALRHQAGLRVQLARVVADEVAEQAERALLGPVLGPRLGPHDVRAAPRVELRDRPRVREQREVRPGTTAARARTAARRCR